MAEPDKNDSDRATTSDLLTYLRELVPQVIGGSEGELNEVLKSNSAILDRFVESEDPANNCLVIVRSVPEANDTDGADGADKESAAPAAGFAIVTDVAYKNPRQACFVLIKRQAIPLVRPLSVQFRVMSFPEGAPFESLHAFIQKAIRPYLTSAVTLRRSAEQASTTKVIADLELQLTQLQQNIDIPEVNLVIHPAVKAAIAKAAANNTTPSVEDFEKEVQDAQFLNALQKGVARWVREMHKVTQVDRDPSSGTAMQEVSFFLNLEAGLQSIKEKRQSPEVTLTIQLLQQGKRFLATTGFDQDTGLDAALEMVNDYNSLMKDFQPVLRNLFTAMDHHSISTALVDIFSHMKKIRNTKYPLTRTLKLVKAISRDLNKQILQVLGNQRFMHVSYKEFDNIIGGCERVFNTWEEEAEKFRMLLRDLIRRRRDDMKTFRRVTPEHKELQERLQALAKFRKQHEQLRTVISRVLRPSAQDEAAGIVDADDQNAIDEVNLAYEDVKSVEALDLSDSGRYAWEQAQRKYDDRIDRVEARIIAKLRDQLGTAKNANEMFRIFGKFNALFVRPSIRGAIREYQSQLIERVKADIDGLHEKFKEQYQGSMNAKMSSVRDLPPVSGQIIWARQIDRQLTEYLKRVEDVLGKGWKDHKEGRALYDNGESFRRKLDTQALFEKWSSEVQKRPLGAAGRIFDIELRRGTTTSLVLSVNFHPQIITVSKEVRNLKWLGFRVPLVIVNKALLASHLYPYAISLKASVRTYQQTLDKLSANESIRSLVAEYHRNIQQSINTGVVLRWESYRLEQYTQELAEKVFVLQEKVDDVLEYNEELLKHIKSLETCKLDRDTISDILEKIQKIVDDLNLRSYSNLDGWVEKLDSKVRAKLRTRLEKALVMWLIALRDYGEKDSDWDARDTGLTNEEISVAELPTIRPLVHEITIRNQVMVLNPPVERARENLIDQLQEFVATLTDLRCIQASKYVMGTETNDLEKSKLTYRSLIVELPNGGAEVLRVFQEIESRMQEVQKYVKIWLQYQALWDLQTDTIINKLGEDLNQWQELLVEIKKARRTFDTSETSKEFGPIIINFAQVQNKVNLKYDQLHRDILNKFGQRLGNSMDDFYATVNRARTDLETQHVDAASTQESVAFITVIQDLKRKVSTWSEDMETYRLGQKVLERQRFAFPEQWRYVDNLEGEWDAFMDILNRKDAQIQGQMGQLQMKVVNEDRNLERRIVSLLADWGTGRNKPVEGKIEPDQAMNTLAIYEGRFTTLKDEYDALSKCKMALDLDSKLDDRLAPSLEELNDLKSSWSELSRIFTSIKDIKSIAWSAVVPRQIKKRLDDLINEMRNLPARVRSYASYESTFAQITSYKSVNKYVEGLKSDAIKERHWRDLMKGLGVRFLLVDLTLGKLWDANLEANSKVVDGVLLVAQGEMALEKFMQQTKEEWSSYELELVNFQNKTKLIKGWVELFDKCRERMASLAAMKLSPYYKVFQEEAQSWDDKLNKVAAVFETWMEVQQRWVYLDGIFSGSADIKHLLPSESSRFQGISTEFLALMKKVSVNPAVLEVVNVPNVQKSLERLSELLQQIQKALGDYLEKERSLFPRFYFVGDEDLLEIIGNAKDTEKLQKHFRKLFSGVHSVSLDDDKENVTGVFAKEGEVVEFQTVVPMKGKKINVWLTNLEKEVNVSLATMLASAAVEITKLKTDWDPKGYLEWLDKFQAQLIVLSIQVVWSESVDAALGGGGDALKEVLAYVDRTMTFMADTVLLYQPPIRRRKLEQNITEMVHQRDVVRSFIADKVSSNKDFKWLSQMRFYFDPKVSNVLEQLNIRVCNAEFFYGFEYLGFKDKLVQTPLTDRAYMTLTQALMARQGGAPFGPAGTGKTETVKMLGNQLGRFTLVFNCDETFDSEAMQRILVGLCQVGAWGCFDEFNRLEEAQLSAVSQQIQTIQLALKRFALGETDVTVEVIQGRHVPLSSDVGIFVTMNPGYAGRSNLPDNLKKLFRSMAMTAPDRQLIAQVMLYSQGFRMAEPLSNKIVPLFILCDEQLSRQSHYDFGLRALKSVLVSAGNIKRAQLERARKTYSDAGKEVDEEQIAADVDEQAVLIESVSETMVPKLVSDDIPRLRSLMADVFPGVKWQFTPDEELRSKIIEVCNERHIVASDSFMTKVLQLYSVTTLAHGLMMVGPSGTGKSTSWRILLEALRRVEKKQAFSYVIDPKAISKDELYGFLDQTTREWTDGVFTHILRKIIDNKLNELDFRQWIVFDGDVDPEWVENLNSVLDDNKLLTLPNGERLAIPPNVRIMFEVQDLNNATLATVSRCGMVWYSDDVVLEQMVFTTQLDRIEHVAMDSNEGSAEQSLQVQRTVVNIVRPYFAENGLVAGALKVAESLEHVMLYTHARVLNSLFAMVKNICRRVFRYNSDHEDFPMAPDVMENFVSKQFIYSMMWCFVGDCKHKFRQEMSDYLRRATNIALPPAADGSLIIDSCVSIEGEWIPWQIPETDIKMENIAGTDVVIPTLDTVRHEDLLYNWLNDHLPVVLCGPPGSGKTMTLFNALRALPDFVVVGLNFSSATSPELILNTFHQHCEYRRTPNGVVLAPIQMNKWLVVFCDEINLPAQDKYDTVGVITFMRQLVEQGGFWRPDKQDFVRLERVQFVGACNPPTDPGRVPLTPRFLRHVPVIYVDYPSKMSYTQIYVAFNRALMKRHGELLNYAEPLTNAMVDFFMQTQERFTADMQPFYIYSPREMTRWIKGIKEAIWPVDTLDSEGLVRIWAHEALRLFQDRLVYDDERQWTETKIDEVAKTHFPNVDTSTALMRPILFSNWLDKNYVPVEREALRKHVEARLKVFHEEELEVPLVLFDEVLDHVLRIDRIFRQNQGHALLIGISGSGKTTLSRFVAWMNGLSVFQVKAHNQYTAADFDEDLRVVLRRAGTKGEKIVFIMDEGNVMDTAFLERINTLLANGEVPGLFEGDEFATLMTQCKEGSQREGVVANGSDELYKWFSEQVMTNLHVVFTMNPAEGGMQDRAATSPALFNRCVLDWFGDWSKSALYQVGATFTAKMDLDKEDYTAPMAFPLVVDEASLSTPITHREAVNNAFVYVHESVKAASKVMIKRDGISTHVTPRHFLECVDQFSAVYNEKRKELEEQQLHLNVGLKKLHDTFTQVAEMQSTLAGKRKILEEKNAFANNKLQDMVQKQQDAEAKKTQSEALSERLAVKLVSVKENKTQVETQLAGVEPAVAEAKKAVDTINQKQLKELQALRNPPVTVKLVLEAVLIMLGEKKAISDWKSVRAVVMQPDFIMRVKDFNSESVNDKMRKDLTKYTENEQCTVEKAYHASQACGPLMQWCLSQIDYVTMLLQIEPLRNELATLEKEANDMKVQKDEVSALVLELEKSIADLKREYAELISEAQAIKTDLESVSTKVERSVKLLDSLEGEKHRWSKGSAVFDEQMSTIIGDAFVSASFLAYAGYFNQQYRTALLTQWREHLNKAGVVWDQQLVITEFLSTPEQQLSWKRNALPADNLCTENAIMLDRCVRYPLIIDPAGQAIEFILSQYGDKKIIKSSFHDPAFRKNLESALRFGTPLLVQDAEKYDPLLNPVLNREVRRVNSRVLITIGDQDIDMSPNVTIILTASDPQFQFSPDLCSRSAIVNFTVTRASLKSQCLNKVLRAERPDVDKKRTDLLKVQGEYRARLHQLEKELLASLNATEGSLLDDDKIIGKLETIKREAADIQDKVDQSAETMLEIESTTTQYAPLAERCSAIYFTMEQLNQVHFLYQYTLQFFLDTFASVLENNPNLEGTAGKYDERLKIVTHDLFKAVYRSVAPGMLDEDRMAFALVLALLELRGTENDVSSTELQQFIVGGNIYGGEQGSFAKLVPDVLTAVSAAQAHALSNAGENFKGLLSNVESDVAAVKTWMESPKPEMDVPALVDTSGAATVKMLREMMLLQVFRPDRLLPKTKQFVSHVLGDDFLAVGQSDFVEFVDKIDSKTPLLLCGVKGYDASANVLDFAESRGKPLRSIAIGSAQGFSAAEKAVQDAAGTGRWVLLTNVHLAPQWLEKLSKTLFMMTPHPSFRLFLSSDITPKLPNSLLRQARKFVFEPAAGVQASLIRTLNSFPDDQVNAAPKERGRLYFLLAWLHAVVQERLRYAPLGWSKTYEFGEPDLKAAAATIDQWMTQEGKNREYLPPDKIPFSALQTLLSQAIYGGRVDNKIDDRMLQSFVENIFSAAAYGEYKLVEASAGQEAIMMPDGSRKEHFLKFAASLNSTQLPSWLGLTNMAERVLLQQRSRELVTKINKLQSLDDDTTAMAAFEPGQENSGGAPAWMQTLSDMSLKWLQKLPDNLSTLKGNAESIKDPLFRFFERELTIAVRLLKQVRSDLEAIQGVCRGELKQTNYLRGLIDVLIKGGVFAPWKCYTFPNTLAVGAWVIDFVERVKQYQKVSDHVASGKTLRSLSVWLGGLMVPEAYFTATRQSVAQAHSWSLEQLHMELEVIADPRDYTDQEFLITDLRFEGAVADGQSLSLVDETFRTVPRTILRWTQDGLAGERVDTPIYLNCTRANLLATVGFEASSGTPESTFYKRGVAILCSSLA